MSNKEWQYSPYQGGTPVLPLTIPTYVRKPTVSFTLGLSTITLPCPELSDDRQLEITRVSRTTLDGSLMLYKDPDWPIVETLSLNFQWIKDEDIDGILQFLNDSLGKNVTYVDHFDRTWIGVITTPFAEAVHGARHNIAINIEFQGELQ